MMEYRIVSALDKSTLAERVNRLLAKGWSLQGGLAVGYGSEGGSMTYFYQAMTRIL